MSRHTLREKSNRPVSPRTGAGNAMRLTMNAENTKVHASSSRASVSGRSPRNGTACPTLWLIHVSTANTAPPSGSVAYVLDQSRASSRSRADGGAPCWAGRRRAPGVHSSEKHSIANDSRKIAQSSPMNAIDAYITPRPRSAMIMICLRSTRSTSAPAIGPNRTAGSMRAIITPLTANPALAADPTAWSPATVTATNPTQSPSDETLIAASSRENAGWVSRSFERRRTGSAECRDLVGDGSHGPSPPPVPR